MLFTLAALMIAATTPAEHIAAGEQALNALEYELAGDELMLAATDPSATDAERLKANLLAGIAHRVAGKDTDAQLNFRYVLLHAPSTTLPDDTPPKVRTFFESVRQELAAERASQASPPPDPASHVASPSSSSPPPAASAARSPSIVSPIVCAAGVAAFAAGAIAAGVVEGELESPSRDGKSVASNVALGQAGLVVAAAGAVAGVAGGVLWMLGGP
jgi:hypothetical protein